jgi:hypothetical protein
VRAVGRSYAYLAGPINSPDHGNAVDELARGQPRAGRACVLEVKQFGVSATAALLQHLRRKDLVSNKRPR